MIDLDALLAAHDGMLLAREHRHRKSSLSRWLAGGRLARLLPGVYVHPLAAEDLRTRVRAVLARVPDAVVCGQAAATLTAWPGQPVAEIEVATASRRRPAPGFRFTRRRVPLDQCRQQGALTVTAPALDNGSRIDDLLRLGRTTLGALGDALAACPRRVGNRARRRVLRRSRSNPWSQAERPYHDLLDAHHITGWVANHPVLLDGRRYFLDIAFPRLQLVLEIDGFETHTTRAAFEEDRRRQNALVVADWKVLRLTWAMLADPSHVVEVIRAAIHRAERSRSRAGRSRSRTAS
jgi:very-short-patch-repair endonuclease